MHDSNVTLAWSARGAPVTQWWLYVGSSQGQLDLLNSGSLGSSLSTTVAGLPTDGSQVHVRLWFMIQGVWQSADFQYTAATAGTPEITSPTPGSVLPGSTVTFEWTGNLAPVTQWWLYVGSSQGQLDLVNSGSLGTGVSITLAGLPTDRSQGHVRLWFLIQGGWQSADFQYSAAG